MNNTLAFLDESLDLGLAGEGRWHRCSVAHGIELREGKPAVDREAGIIYGYSVISMGPALGHDMEVDSTTLDQVVQFGNASKSGIKSRFDHPNASNTSMGTFLGRTKNFRKSGARVIGDLHLSESAKEAPQGDLYSYVLGLAERDPEAFGASIVFEGKAEQQLDDEGSSKKDSKGHPLPRLARVERLLASDVVDDPAANPGGMFEHGEHSLATKITAFLNRWATHDLLPTLQALMATHKEDSMSEVQTITPAHVELARAEGLASGVKAERDRVSAITKSFSSVWGDHAPAAELAVRDGLVGLGTSAADAETAFKTRKLTQIADAAPASAGGGSEPLTEKKVDLSKLSIDERAKAEWEQDSTLRAEFGALSTYIAFLKAEAEGKARIKK